MEGDDVGSVSWWDLGVRFALWLYFEGLVRLIAGASGCWGQGGIFLLKEEEILKEETELSNYFMELQLKEIDQSRASVLVEAVLQGGMVPVHTDIRL